MKNHMMHKNIHDSHPSIGVKYNQTVDRSHYHKNRQMESEQYTQHNRNQSDEITQNLNTQNLVNNGRYVSIQGNTVINTNV